MMGVEQYSKGDKYGLKHLFSPLKIRGMELKNRIIMPAMTTLLGNADGTVSDGFIEYYAARARGGAALITAETVDIHPYTHNLALGERGLTAIYDDQFIPGLKRFTDTMHDLGAKTSVQLHHSGQAMLMIDPSQPPLAPSALPCPGGAIPRALTISEIEELVEAYGNGALRAQKAGFDAVDIHGGHGYLIAQFMSAWSNRRTDRYGGDLMGRLRFPLEVLRKVREMVGDHFPIIFRYSADERIQGGRRVAESAMIAPLLVEAGADCLSITTGMHFTLYYTVPAMGLPKGLNIETTARVKSAVAVPVVAVGKLNDPLVAESALAKGSADLIAIGRGLIADPELPNKWEEGRFGDVRPCISCNQGCIGGMMSGASFSCMVNPSAGREIEMPVEPAPRPKRIVVAGGGPAGLEAANTAAVRGHSVTLYEKEDHLGGQFHTASIPPGKQEISLYIKYMESQMRLAGVEVILNRKLDAADIADADPDVVILATGGLPTIPDIPGSKAQNVVTAPDVLKGKVETGRRVLVAGGGLVGCETALFLDALGKEVIVVEMMAEPASDQIMVPRESLLRKLDQTKVKLVTSAKILKFNQDSVIVERYGSQETIGGIETVILAMGVDSTNELTYSIQLDRPEIHVIGDAKRPSNALDAIAAGVEIGRRI